jgi:glycosyltransferase involved in cell wall biosynthesis/predicted SAM-dependent methyltransferase/Flp pilus assembly protein TadD
MKDLKLNLGCGPKRLAGYINIDIVPSAATDMVADILKLPFPDESCDEIRMDAVFEHIYRHDRPQALQTWRNMLKPGGKLVLNWIPDFDAVIDAYVHKKPGILHPEFDLFEVWRFTHGQYTPNDIPYQLHKDIFTVASVQQELDAAGFENVRVQNVRYEQEPVSVNIQAIAFKSAKAGISPTPTAAASPAQPSPVARAGQKLSVVINTLNAGEHLEDCLKSVKAIADEIIIVDMHSDDNTLAIARQYTTRIFFHDRTGYVEPARNFALAQATGDWILLIDVDERVTPLLAKLIHEKINNPGGLDVFQLPRHTFIAGRWLLGTGWGIDYECQPRLFRKGALTFSDKIHERPKINGREGFINLPAEAGLTHFNYKNLHHFIERMNRYTDIEADNLKRNGTKWSLATMLTQLQKEVDFRYEPQKDGVHSLILTLAMAFYRFLSWAKLWEKEGYPQVALPQTSKDLARWLFDPADNQVAWSQTEQALIDKGFHHPGSYDPLKQANVLNALLEQISAKMQQGNLEAAIQSLDQALALSPFDTELIITRANLFFQKGDHDITQRELHRAALLAPDSVMPYYYLGAFYLETAQLSEAEEMLQKALDKAVDNLEVCMLLGKLYLKIPKYAKAIEMYERILKQTPNDINSNLALGLSYFQLRNYPAAYEKYRNALNLDPNNKTARASLEILKTMVSPEQILQIEQKLASPGVIS